MVPAQVELVVEMRLELVAPRRRSRPPRNHRRQIMSTNVFHDPTAKVPTKDGRIMRVDFGSSETGARTSHLPKTEQVKNSNSIEHVK